MRSRSKVAVTAKGPVPGLPGPGLRHCVNSTTVTPNGGSTGHSPPVRLPITGLQRLGDLHQLLLVEDVEQLEDLLAQRPRLRRAVLQPTRSHPERPHRNHPPSTPTIRYDNTESPPIRLSRYTSPSCRCRA